MNLLFVIPELALFAVLLLVLFSFWVDRASARVLSILSAGVSWSLGIYYFIRPDIQVVGYPGSILISDRISLFTRLFFLFFLPIAFWAIHLLSSLNDRQKKSALLQWVTLSLLGSLVVQASNVLLFGVSWLGGVLVSGILILVEARLYKNSAKRMASLLMIALVSTLFAVFSWIFPESREVRALFGLCITFTILATPSWITLFEVKAPLTLGWFLGWLYFTASIFWMRFGFESLLEPEKYCVAAIWGIAAIVSVGFGMRTKSIQLWLGYSVYPVVMMALFPILAGVNAASERFLIFLPVLYLTTTLFGLILHHERWTSLFQKVMIPVVLSILGAVVVTFGEIPISYSIIYSVIWSLLGVSSLQMMFQIMHDRSRQNLDGANVVFRGAYAWVMISLLGLTTIVVVLSRSLIIEAFAQHSVKHLW